MSAPSKAYTLQLVRIQPEERLATTSELNPAPGGVTRHREARRKGYRAATQVKGLSPERTNVENGPTRFMSWQAVADLAIGALGIEYGRDGVTPADERAGKQGIQTSTCSCYVRASMASRADAPGSETVARYQMDSIGTRETQSIPARVCSNKPEKGKEPQMMFWESDRLIVVMKQCNACGAKGPAGEPWNGDTSSALRGGQREAAKPISVTHLLYGEEVFLKSRMREIRKSGSVRGFIVDSEGDNLLRRWL